MKQGIKPKDIEIESRCEVCGNSITYILQVINEDLYNSRFCSSQCETYYHVGHP